VEGHDRAVVARERKLEGLERKSHELLAASEAKLMEVAELSRDEARKRLIASVEEETRMDIARRVKALEEQAREQADRKAKRIIAMAIQRYAGEYVAEKTVSVVNLPNEEMKGRIIGREGRNIRAIEAATGIDLIIDDTPEAVILSGFHPMRREVARISLERLIADGRIHPSRIEEVVHKVEEEIEASVRESGEQATFELQVNNVHPEIIRLIGQLRYRTSYGQNQYAHSVDVGFLAGTMAAELGLNIKLAKRAGLLHDIGKVIDQSAEGSHAIIGAEFAKRYGENKIVVNAIAAHHEEVPKESIYAALVQAADALSGARPGARREILESYIRRLEDLERIANSFDGVDKSYAIQAGRELRIIVASDAIGDAEAILLSKEIAQKVESELTYPGQIKVTVIRETRAIEYAR
jgi:ribonuclease Y